MLHLPKGGCILQKNRRFKFLLMAEFYVFIFLFNVISGVLWDTPFVTRWQYGNQQNCKIFCDSPTKKILPNLLYDKLPQCSKVIYLESISIEDINNINPYISSFPESWKVTTFINICKSTSVKTAIIQKLEASGKSAGKENINNII